MPVIEKPNRHRSKLHLQHVRTNRCLACGAPAPSQAHHITFAQPKARGLKSGDQWSVPLCMDCHNSLHARGDERAWWESLNKDPMLSASELWAHTIAERERHETPKERGSATPTGIKRTRARDTKAPSISRHAWARHDVSEPTPSGDDSEYGRNERGPGKSRNPSRRWPVSTLRKGVRGFSRDKVRI